MPTIALLAPQGSAATVFSEEHFTRIAASGTFVDARFTNQADEVIGKLADVDIILSTWGMPVVDNAFITAVPNLKAIFYAAGTVKGFVTPTVWEHNITISSAAPANAVPVAEYTLGVILLSNKRFWSVKGKTQRVAMPGNYQRTIGIIGASMVGREVIRLLKSYDLKVLLYDPFVNGDAAKSMGVRKVDLPTLMAESDVVSLHAPNLPELRHMLNADPFSRMKDGATFINTARGALVDEAALIAELQRGRIFAILDVTDPEPPVADSPFFTLPNVVYTPHIAGSLDQECHRMADFAISEMERFLAGEPLQNAIRHEALTHLA
ncbi:MAG TPA: hydroxyacid dehydrogenase [Armatimonadota bacterium]|nr:hydroxyacid dehydrogenase [Armatimonadota bacterium]